MENNKNNVVKLTDIPEQPILRNRTCFDDLDILYGISDSNIGMPKGKISLWAGQAGVGKSRLCIEVAKKFTTRYTNGVVLYFQTEAPLEDFAQWAKDDNWKAKDLFYCSGENKIDEIIKIIYQVKPKLIFIDSVNEIEEFESGNKKEARRLIKGIGDKPGLRKATHDVGAHLILLGQLNQDGKTIKGGTSLPHLVDIALNVVLEDARKGIFRVEVGTKHRYGSREHVARFQHNNKGVVKYSFTPTEVKEVVEVVEDVKIGEKGKWFIGDHGEWTDIITPKMQAAMDDDPYITEKEPGLYTKIGNFLGDILGK